MENTNQQTQLDPKISAIVKALAYTENGGEPDLSNPSAGQSGEMKSIFQFLPGTWKLYAKQVSGNPNLPLNAENETKIAYAKVASWYAEDAQDGYTPDQITERIASRWNAGEQKPDAYLGNKGVNKQGVPYNTTKYAKKVLTYANQFGNNDAVGTSQTQPSTLAINQPQTPQSGSNPGMMPPFTLKTPQQSGGNKKGMINEMA